MGEDNMPCYLNIVCFSLCPMLYRGCRGLYIVASNRQTKLGFFIVLCMWRCKRIVCVDGGISVDLMYTL